MVTFLTINLVLLGNVLYLPHTRKLLERIHFTYVQSSSNNLYFFIKNPLNINPIFYTPLWCLILSTRGRHHHTAYKIFTFPADV